MGPGTGGAGASGQSTGGTVGSGGAGTGGQASGGVVGSGGAGSGGRGTGGGATAGTAGMGQGGAGIGGAGGRGSGGTGDTARYSFEGDVQGWANGTFPGLTRFAAIATSTTQRFAGGSSLAGTINSTGVATYNVTAAPPVPAIPAGATITFHVYVPAGALVDYVQPYIQESAPSYRWTGTGIVIPQAVWNTLTVTTPNPILPIAFLGIQFVTLPGTWSGTVYVDSVNY
jgi:hypothetical protein